jgi:hypothetical protein
MGTQGWTRTYMTGRGRDGVVQAAPCSSIVKLADGRA